MWKTLKALDKHGIRDNAVLRTTDGWTIPSGPNVARWKLIKALGLALGLEKDASFDNWIASAHGSTEASSAPANSSGHGLPRYPNT
jgi:hypothetical protein